MLRVIEIHDRNQQWLGVADIMRAEAHEEANAALDRSAARASSITGVMPERVVREGEKAEEILKLIEEDEDIALLILAPAADRRTGPWSRAWQDRRHVSHPGRDRARHLSDEDLDSMS